MTPADEDLLDEHPLEARPLQPPAGHLCVADGQCWTKWDESQARTLGLCNPLICPHPSNDEKPIKEKFGLQINVI